MVIMTYVVDSEFLKAFDFESLKGWGGYLEIYSANCIRLTDAAYRLGTTSKAICSILEDAGYTIKDNKHTWLTYDHIEILKQNYLTSIKKLYKKVSRKKFSVEETHFKTFVNFF